MHVRQQIREKIKGYLDQGSEWRGVFASRVQPSRNVWPYLNIYIESEDVQTLVIHPGPIEQRTLHLNIEGRVRIPQDTQQVEDNLDALAEVIESRMLLLKDDAKSVILLSTYSEIDTDDPDRSYGLIVLNYDIVVHTTSGKPWELL